MLSITEKKEKEMRLCVFWREVYIKKSYSPARKKQLARPSHAWTTNVNNHEASTETVLIKTFTSYYEWVNSFKDTFVIT